MAGIINRVGKVSLSNIQHCCQAAAPAKLEVETYCNRLSKLRTPWVGGCAGRKNKKGSEVKKRVRGVAVLISLNLKELNLNVFFLFIK